MAETVDGTDSHASNSTPNDSFEGPDSNATVKHATCVTVANANVMAVGALMRLSVRNVAAEQVFLWFISHYRDCPGFSLGF